MWEVQHRAETVENCVWLDVQDQLEKGVRSRAAIVAYARNCARLGNPAGDTNGGDPAIQWTTAVKKVDQLANKWIDLLTTHGAG